MTLGQKTTAEVVALKGGKYTVTVKRGETELPSITLPSQGAVRLFLSARGIQMEIPAALAAEVKAPSKGAGK